MTSYNLHQFTMAHARPLVDQVADIAEWDDDELERKITYPGARVTGIIDRIGPYLVIETDGAVITDVRTGEQIGTRPPAPELRIAFTWVCEVNGVRGADLEPSNLPSSRLVTLPGRVGTERAGQAPPPPPPPCGPRSSGSELSLPSSRRRHAPLPRRQHRRANRPPGPRGRAAARAGGWPGRRTADGAAEPRRKENHGHDQPSHHSASPLGDPVARRRLAGSVRPMRVPIM